MLHVLVTVLDGSLAMKSCLICIILNKSHDELNILE